MPRKEILAAAAALSLTANGAPDGPVDADSQAWWSLTAELSNDSMEGRETGSGGHERAARLAARRMAAAGLRPLGENGTFYQRIAFEDVTVTDATLAGPGGPLDFLDEFYVRGNAGLPAAADVPIAYRGYCEADKLGDVRGKLVICHGTRRDGFPTGAERDAAVRAAGAAGLATIADPGFTDEPPRWPFAYARRVSLAGQGPAVEPFIEMTLNADALGRLLDGHDAQKLVADGAAGKPLPSFDGGIARMTFVTSTAQYTSPNVIGMLPGTDPALADQAIVMGAHLDGYGFGRAVNGDPVYNGTLDDAAYVALLLHLVEQRQGRGFRRPIVLTFWTGEEKGLFGSRWFIDHPTLPLDHIAGNINLDQLRPIFPLEILTVHARTDSTLGEMASALAAERGIKVQDDPEPARGMIRRSDHWNFLKAGIPSVNFVFGFEPGSPSEEIYRHWYETGYHKPQDDLDQPMDWQAAADFNRFVYALVDRVADADDPPAWRPGSALAPTARVE